jgi:hypothetical protein
VRTHICTTGVYRRPGFWSGFVYSGSACLCAACIGAYVHNAYVCVCVCLHIYILYIYIYTYILIYITAFIHAKTQEYIHKHQNTHALIQNSEDSEHVII